MSYHPDKLRLEVEVPTGGLRNLVLNPSGSQGPWGWETPLAGNFMQAGSNAHILSTGSSAAPARAQTEAMPVLAGNYVGARLDTTNGTSSGYYFRAFFAYYDSAGALISVGPTTAYLLAQTNATRYIPTAQTPAGTAYVRLVLDLYSNASGATPAANSIFTFRNVMVVTAASAAAIGDNRTNVIGNPNFDTDASGWSPDNSSTIARVTTPVQAGTGALRFTGTYAGNAVLLRSALFTPTAGQTFTASAYLRSNGATTGEIGIFWYRTSGGNYIDKTLVNLTSAYTRGSVTTTAPAGVTKGEFVVLMTPPSDGTGLFLDSVLVEQGSTLNAYYAGTVSNASFPFAEPNGWQDIIGPVFDVGISAEPLGIGTMSATILSQSLDPSISQVLRPGKRVRLVDNTGEPVYTGRLTNAKVNYAKAKGGSLSDKGAVRITVEAADNAAALAQQTEPRGVEAIASLPALLEGKGVPWNINGSSAQTAVDPAIVATNPQASPLDQVAITRDTKRGYAWIDRANVLQVWDRTSLSTTPAARFSDVSDSVGNAVNRITNPEPSTTYYVSSSTAAATVSFVNEGRPAARFTRVTTASVALNGGRAAATPPIVSAVGEEVLTLMFTLKSSVDCTVISGLNQTTSNNSTDLTSTNVTHTLTAGEPLTVRRTITVPATGTHIGQRITPRWVWNSGQGAVGDYFDVSDVAWIDGTYTGEYFSGNTANTGAVDYTWQGTANNSFSNRTKAANVLSYTDIDVSYNTQEVINSVTIKWLRYNSGTGTADEISYGPYINSESVAAYGTFSKEFTIQGATESEANVRAYADAVLAANGTPSVKVNSLRMPVRNAAEMTAAITLGLYSTITVYYADRVATDLRITGISHNITPEDWDVTYTFSVAGSAAATINTPSPSDVAISSGWNPLPFSAGWENWKTVDPSFQACEYKREGNKVWLRGLARKTTATGAGLSNIGILPVGFRPSAYNTWVTNNQETFYRLQIGADGGVQVYNPSVGLSAGTYVTIHGWFSLD